MLSSGSYVGFIPVLDLAEARSFYAETLGLPVLEDTPFAVVLDAGGTRVRVTPVPELIPQGFTIAGWRVDDIDATVRSLASNGVTFERYAGMDQDELGIWTTPTGHRIAWFEDPAGNLLSLTADPH